MMHGKHGKALINYVYGFMQSTCLIFIIEIFLPTNIDSKFERQVHLSWKDVNATNSEWPEKEMSPKVCKMASCNVTRCMTYSISLEWILHNPAVNQ